MRCLVPALGLLLIASMSASSNEKKADNIAYEVFPRYFVKNTVKLPENSAFFVLQDKKSFDEIFGIGFVMGKKPKLVDDKLFEGNLIVTAIKTGNTPWTYEVEDVCVEKQQLIVKYKTAGKESSAKYTVPLIVAVPRGEFTEVVFIENGKEAGKAVLKK